jgi:hypothetical protein
MVPPGRIELPTSALPTLEPEIRSTRGTIKTTKTMTYGRLGVTNRDAMSFMPIYSAYRRVLQAIAGKSWGSESASFLARRLGRAALDDLSDQLASDSFRIVANRHHNVVQSDYVRVSFMAPGPERSPDVSLGFH